MYMQLFRECLHCNIQQPHDSTVIDRVQPDQVTKFRYGTELHNVGSQFLYPMVFVLFRHAPIRVCGAEFRHQSLHSGQFWAISIASFRERFLDFRSCWIVFTHVISGRPSGLLQWPGLRLSRYSWHLLRLAFVQCAQTDVKQRDWTKWYSAITFLPTF